MASIFAILYIGAIPIPIDIESETYNLDVNLIEDKITKKLQLSWRYICLVTPRYG